MRQSEEKDCEWNIRIGMVNGPDRCFYRLPSWEPRWMGLKSLKLHFPDALGSSFRGTNESRINLSLRETEALCWLLVSVFCWQARL